MTMSAHQISKKSKIVIFIATVFLVLNTIPPVSFPHKTASANSLPGYNPVREMIAGRAGNMACEKRNDVRINKEVLDIDLTSGASIRAEYTMENITDNEINVNTMFLYPQTPNSNNKKYSVEKNGGELESEYYVMPYDGSAFEDWESAITAAANSADVFDDGTGYCEYTVNLSDGVPNISFSSETGIIIINNEYTSASYNEITGYSLSSKNNNYSIKFISTGDSLDIKGEYDELETEEIPDIYAFLYSHFETQVEAYERDYKRRFYDNMNLSAYLPACFNRWLHDLEKKDMTVKGKIIRTSLNDSMIDELRLRNAVGVIVYELNLKAHETAVVAVEYDYATGGKCKNDGIFRNRTVRYYLTPAKYYESFKDLTINLTLGEADVKLTESSLSFAKTGKKTYQYKSDELPDKELFLDVLTQKGRSVKNRPFVIVAIIAIVIAVFIIIIVSFSKMAKESRKNREAEQARFQTAWQEQHTRRQYEMWVQAERQRQEQQKIEYDKWLWEQERKKREEDNRK